MERASRLLRQSKIFKECASESDMARAAWMSALGRRLAGRTHPVGLVRGRLVVEVEDDIWQRQLFTLREQILAKIEEVAGPGLVTALEFRVGVPRRMPAREEMPVRGGIWGSPAAQKDEADSIEDPILRRIYLESRKRASA